MTTTELEVDDRIARSLAVAEPNTLDHQWKVAQLLARSHYFQDAGQAPQAFTKILAGYELGFGPIASMQGIYIVNGRVTYAANLIAAAIQKSGKFRYRVHKLDRTGCSITFFERGDPSSWEPLGESTFDPQDAEAAGLAKKDTFKGFPRNMYFARALTNGARWYCPEVFNGPVYTPDELGATVDDDGRVIDIPSAPPMDTDARAKLANSYDEIFGADEPATTERNGRTVDTTTGEVVSEQPQPTTKAQKQVTSIEDRYYQRYSELAEEAAELGIDFEVLELPVSAEYIAERGRELTERIAAARAKQQQATEVAAF